MVTVCKCLTAIRPWNFSYHNGFDISCVQVLDDNAPLKRNASCMMIDMHSTYLSSNGFHIVCVQVLDSNTSLKYSMHIDRIFFISYTNGFDISCVQMLEGNTPLKRNALCMMNAWWWWLTCIVHTYLVMVSILCVCRRLTAIRLWSGMRLTPALRRCGGRGCWSAGAPDARLAWVVDSLGCLLGVI